MKSLTPAGKFWLGWLAVVILVIGFISAASATKPKDPAQEQNQHQGQLQGQHQVANGGSAINEGVTSVAENVANVSQNVDTPSLTLGLGGAYAPDSFATAPCMGPVEADAKRGGKTGIGVLGLFSRGAHLETKPWCVEMMMKQLELQERELAIRENAAGMVPVGDYNDCQDNVTVLAGGLQACEESFDAIREGK